MLHNVGISFCLAAYVWLVLGFMDNASLLTF